MGIISRVFDRQTDPPTDRQYNNQTAITINVNLFIKPRGGCGGGGGVVVVVFVVVVVVVWSTRGLHEVGDEKAGSAIAT